MQRFWLFILVISLPAILILGHAWDWSVEPANGSDLGCPPDCVATVMVSATAEAQEVPPRYINLQVLPENITKDELKRTMKLITKSLGTECNFCHRTDIKDYASDEIKEKVIARHMMRMVERLNRELITWQDVPKATCFMCHHGQRKSQMHP